MGSFCWGDPKTDHADMKAAGFDITWSYHWPTFAKGALREGIEHFTSDEIISGHQYCWTAQSKAKIPNIVTCSMGWDSAPWNNSCTTRKWRLTPDEFKSLLQEAKNFMNQQDPDLLESQILFLDNWNEFGEGHYIMPTEQYGFGYLNAVKEVFHGC
jgi:hypothetical protein